MCVVIGVRMGGVRVGGSGGLRLLRVPHASLEGVPRAKWASVARLIPRTKRDHWRPPELRSITARCLQGALVNKDDDARVGSRTCYVYESERKVGHMPYLMHGQVVSPI